MVSPSQYYQWVPSNVWVGVGRMSVDQVRFKLEKMYNHWGIEFKQAKVTAIYPEGDSTSEKSFVEIMYTNEIKKGETERVTYDYLVNATGPKLNFEATEGLGPGKNTVSVCTYDHAAHSWEEPQKCSTLMKMGQKRRFLMGTRHPVAPCQSAAS